MFAIENDLSGVFVEPGFFERGVDRFVQISDLVDKLGVERLRGGINSTVGDFAEFFATFGERLLLLLGVFNVVGALPWAAFDDDVEESFIGFVDERLPGLHFFFRRLFHRASHSLHCAACDGVGAHAELLTELCGVHQGADDADRTGPRRGLGEDFVRRRGDVIPSARGQIAHTHDDRNIALLLELTKRSMVIGAPRDGSSRRVDAQDDRFDRFVFFRFFERDGPEGGRVRRIRFHYPFEGNHDDFRFRIFVSVDDSSGNIGVKRSRS